MLDMVVGIATLSSLFLLLNATGVYADSSVVDEVTITVPVSCSLSATVGTVHTATVEVGTYTDDIGETTFKVLCNDSNGFAVYAIGFSDDTYGNTAMKPSSVADTNAIATGTAVSGSTSNWAMKLTAVSGDYSPTLATGFNAYHAVPAEYTKVASLGSSTDATVGSSFKSTYAAFVSQAQPADTYTGKVKYTVVHPANGAAPVDFDMAFANANKTKLNGHYRMQDMTSAICSSVNLVDDASQTTLIDSRDNKTYTVSKLRDGNCWMTQNLDLDLDSETTYTNLDTDLGWNGTSYSTASWTPEYSTFTTSATDWNFYSYKPESYDPGNLYWNGVVAPVDEDSCETAGGVWDGFRCTDLNLADYTSSTGDVYYHLGNYYNWSAAVATNDSRGYSYEEDATQSICPAGWSLPPGGYYDNLRIINKSFSYLVDQYGYDYDGTFMLSNGIISYEEPLHLVLSGVIGYDGNEIGLQGHYWSSTSMGELSAHQFGSCSDGSVWAEGDDSNGYGFSIRCVAR